MSKKKQIVYELLSIRYLDGEIDLTSLGGDFKTKDAALKHIKEFYYVGKLLAEHDRPLNIITLLDIKGHELFQLRGDYV